jgi:transcriptional regulator with XRE-family HTH domain
VPYALTLGFKDNMNTKNIGKNFKEIIDFLGLTQAEAAEKCDMTQAAVSQIVNGERLPSLESICAILTAFNVKFERLVK